jgi:hypothetical protein
VWHHHRPKPLEIPQSLLFKKCFEFLQKEKPKNELTLEVQDRNKRKPEIWLVWKLEAGRGTTSLPSLSLLPGPGNSDYMATSHVRKRPTPL